MPADAERPKIFISAAEQSADEHAAALIRAFRVGHGEAVFSGLAGPAMRAAGCGCLHDLTPRSAMALAAVRRVPEALRLLHRLKSHLRDGGYDAAVVVDSPTLNLPIARLCRRAGVPVLYYIAPQTWAWAAWRNRRIRRRVDRIACIWPFEEAWFREHGILATYVGHPTFDRLLAAPIDVDRVAELRRLGPPVMTLLPGSRRHVVQEVLPGQLEVAVALRKRFPRAFFLVVPANEEVRDVIEPMIAASRLSRAVRVLWPKSAGSGDEAAVAERLAGDRAAAIRAAEIVLVASGTVTLEVAFHGTPMIVMYNSSRLGYELIGRWLISTPHLSIPNILAGRRLVPEFMPYYRTVDPIIATAVEWLSTPGSLDRVRRELLELIQPLVRPGAAAHAADELAALLPRGGDRTS